MKKFGNILIKRINHLNIIPSNCITVVILCFTVCMLIVVMFQSETVYTEKLEFNPNYFTMRADNEYGVLKTNSDDFCWTYKGNPVTALVYDHYNSSSSQTYFQIYDMKTGETHHYTYFDIPLDIFEKCTDYSYQDYKSQ